ncbi:MAG TPA: hypothetical protein VGO47_01690, partial [Chlamydiales bacterium]|nr:hypothetical protein [Chlamydiales bacterium]
GEQTPGFREGLSEISGSLEIEHSSSQVFVEDIISDLEGMRVIHVDEDDTLQDEEFGYSNVIEGPVFNDS